MLAIKNHKYDYSVYVIILILVKNSLEFMLRSVTDETIEISLGERSTNLITGMSAILDPRGMLG